MAAPVPNPDWDDWGTKLTGEVCKDSAVETDRYLTFDPDPLTFDSLSSPGENPLDFDWWVSTARTANLPLTGVLADQQRFEFGMGEWMDGAWESTTTAVVDGAEGAYEWGKGLYDQGKNYETEFNEWGEGQLGKKGWNAAKDATLELATGESFRTVAGNAVNSTWAQSYVRDGEQFLQDTFFGGNDSRWDVSLGTIYIPTTDTLRFSTGVWYKRSLGFLESKKVLLPGGDQVISNLCIVTDADVHIGMTGSIDLSDMVANGTLDANAGIHLTGALTADINLLGITLENYELIGAHVNLGANYDLLNGGGMDYGANGFIYTGWSLWF